MTWPIFSFVLTFVAVVGGLGVLAYFACRRLVRHIRKTPEAAKQIVDHVILPLFEKEKPLIEKEDETAEGLP